ncbi:hypothetical protein, partial [Rhodococcus ruber]|uniref:hypothetical protein n=1 Tax=Rhodococcus ruber TaxID=1830 RepID=UPI001366307B
MNASASLRQLLTGPQTDTGDARQCRTDRAGLPRQTTSTPEGVAEATEETAAGFPTGPARSAPSTAESVPDRSLDAAELVGEVRREIVPSPGAGPTDAATHVVAQATGAAGELRR